MVYKIIEEMPNVELITSKFGTDLKAINAMEACDLFIANGAPKKEQEKGEKKYLPPWRVVLEIGYALRCFEKECMCIVKPQVPDAGAAVEFPLALQDSPTIQVKVTDGIDSALKKHLQEMVQKARDVLQKKALADAVPEWHDPIMHRRGQHDNNSGNNMLSAYRDRHVLSAIGMGPIQVAGYKSPAEEYQDLKRIRENVIEFLPEIWKRIKDLTEGRKYDEWKKLFTEKPLPIVEDLESWPGGKYMLLLRTIMIIELGGGPESKKIEVKRSPADYSHLACTNVAGKYLEMLIVCHQECYYLITGRSY